MTSDPCREMRPLLGAAALGGLDPGEQIALQAHLDGCADCREELRELASVADALPVADVGRVTGSRPEPSTALGEQVRDRLALERARRRLRLRRRMVLGAAAAVAAAAVIAAVLVVTVPGSSGGGTRVVFPAARGVEASAVLHAQPAGTEVEFHVRGLQGGAYYWLWLTGADGDRIAAGTFQGAPTPVDVTMTAAIPLDDARRIWVTDAANHVVLDQHLPA